MTPSPRTLTIAILGSAPDKVTHDGTDIDVFLGRVGESFTLRQRTDQVEALYRREGERVSGRV